MDLLSYCSKNWTKRLPCWFKQCFGLLNMFIARKCSDMGVSGIYVTLLFAVYNFRNKSLLRLIFSSNYSKFYEDFRNAEKNWENISRFLDNCIWIGCFRHSLLLRRNTCHRVSICWLTVWRFPTLLRQNFSRSIFFKVIKKYDITTVMLI